MRQNKLVKIVSLSVVVMGLLVILAFIFNAMQYANLVARLGHEAIMATRLFFSDLSRKCLIFAIGRFRGLIVHLRLYQPLYIIILALLSIPVSYHLVRRSQWSTSKNRCETVLKQWQDCAKKEQRKNQALLQKYSDLKKNVNEAACGHDVFNADDTISLQHPFCKEFHEFKRIYDERGRQNLRLTQELSFVRRKAMWVVPTPEYIAAMRCREIEEQTAKLERLELDSRLRMTEIKELRGALAESMSGSEVAGLKTNIDRLQKGLSQKNAELTLYRKTNEELKTQMSKIVLERDTYERILEAASKANLDLDKQIAGLKKALQNKDSQIEQLKQPGQDQVNTAQGAFQTAQNEAKAAKYELNSTKNKLESAQEAVAELRRLLAEKEQGLRNCNGQIEALKANQSVSPSSVSPKSGSKALKDELVTLKTAMTELLQASKQAKEQHAREIAAAKTEIAKWYQASQTPTGADVRGSKEYQDLLANARTVEQERNQLDEKVNQLMTTQNTGLTTETIQAAEIKYAELEKDRLEKAEHIEEAKKIIISKDQEIRDKERKLLSQNKQITAQIQQIAEKDQRIAEQYHHIQEQNKSIESLAFSLDDDVTESPLLDTGSMVRNLENDIATLKAKNAQMDANLTAKEATIEQNDRKILELILRTEIAEMDRDKIQGESDFNATRLESLDEIERLLTLHNITDSKVEISAQIDGALQQARDAWETYALLHKRNLLTPENGMHVYKHVRHLANEHDRHQSGAGELWTRLVEIETLLRGKFGPTGPEEKGDVLVRRVKRLINGS